jgi:NFU1 iron-sulfur cluster scaffold homolog, mitochondrial
MRDKAEALIEEIIRPLVETDGGRIELISADNNRVVIQLSGTCAGCPGRFYTTTGVIEPIFRKTFGESVTITYTSEPLE